MEFTLLKTKKNTTNVQMTAKYPKTFTRAVGAHTHYWKQFAKFA